ncbi:MAG: hypothetical protein ABF904_01310 [Ethanoligenens sp.]
MDEDTGNDATNKWADWMDIRLNALESQYEAQHVTDFDKATLEKLRRQLCELLGAQNVHLLYAYTDRLIALYNRDGDWFYKQGWQDALQVLQDAPTDWRGE